MTATAFALEPALDYFDDVDALVPARPELRLIHGERAGPGYAAVVPPRRAPQSAETVERYRRRRFLFLMAVTVAIVVISQLSGISLLGLGSGAAESVDGANSIVHVVRPGDTYAAIASVFGAENPNVVAGQLQAANGGSELVVGQRLVFDLGSLGAGSFGAGSVGAGSVGGVAG